MQFKVRSHFVKSVKTYGEKIESNIRLYTLNRNDSETNLRGMKTSTRRVYRTLRRVTEPELSGEVFGTLKEQFEVPTHTD